MNRHLLLAAIIAFAAPAGAQQITPPQPVEMPPAVAPEGGNQEATVVLLVTIGADGSVRDVSVASSGGAALDAAAIAAVLRWKFKPALRDGQPFEARVRIPFRFEAAPSPAAPAQGAAQIPVQSAPTPQPVAPQPAPPPPPAPAPPEPTGPAERAEEVTVRGSQAKVEHGASDFVIDVGQLAVVPRRNAEHLLELAPGIFLANEGGECHAEQVFMRGFNAEQGQAIEFSVNGVPINEVDNPDSHGYADTHFIIPELIKSLQVTEGPFDPRQGDFARAGSARYELGVSDRGLRLSATAGSYDTRRFLALWAPKGEREGTFAAAQFSDTAGYGINRAGSNASAMAQYEGELGQRGLFRVFASTYAGHCKSAGVLRKDMVDAGTIDFYGTLDPSQGADASRHIVSLELESPLESGVLSGQVFFSVRTLRIVENFTGFLLDTQEAGQSLHGQRGDAVEKDYNAFTTGARGSYRLRFRLLDREHAIEVGSYARYDHTRPLVQRLRFGTQDPYLNDLDLETDVLNIAGYVDADLRPLPFLTLRGGVRDEFYQYNVLDNCFTRGNFKPGQPLDVNCPSYDRAGPRSPSRRVTATGDLLAPRATALIALPLGLTLTASYGVGAVSLDPVSITQDENAPFVKLKAFEGGLLARGSGAGFDWTARAVGYQTKADRDQILDPNLGRATTTSATTRTGLVLAARATSRWLDEAASFTTVHPVFDDTGTLVPYTPLVIGRSDTALSGPLPWPRFGESPLRGTLGVGVGYIGKRSLPFGQFSDPTVQIDASASVRWRWLKGGVQVTNLTDRRFPLSQFFYASDFHSRPYPTLAPAAHFTAAPPRIVLFTLELLLDRQAD